MILSLRKNDLLNYVIAQLNVFFPDKKPIRKNSITGFFGLALDRAEFCFSKINVKYFWKDNSVYFDHLHADQYAMFLYLLSRTLFQNNADIEVCNKLFQLNRYLHGIDVFYEVALPDIFLFVHPLGTVLGRAKYGNYFLVYQRCNVGSNKNVYPAFSDYVTLHPGAAVLGNCQVGKNCKIGTGSLLLDKDLEQDSIYIGNPRDFLIKKSKERMPIWFSSAEEAC